MTTTSQPTVVGAVTAVSKLTDSLQNNHWTDGDRPVCSDKSVPDHAVLYNNGFTTRFYYESLFVYYVRRVFYFRLIDLHFRFNLVLRLKSF